MKYLILLLIAMSFNAHAAKSIFPDCDDDLTKPKVLKREDVEERFRQQRLPAEMKMTSIKSAYDSLSDADKKYFALTFKAINAAIGKHHQSFLRSAKPSGLDVTRHFHILKVISEFDPSRGKYSLYKIKRAIEAAYNLEEYVECTSTLDPA
jgi:hypothetical protein